jgi:hypothetical protein
LIEPSTIQARLRAFAEEHGVTEALDAWLEVMSAEPATFDLVAERSRVLWEYAEEDWEQAVEALKSFLPDGKGPRWTQVRVECAHCKAYIRTELRTGDRAVEKAFIVMKRACDDCSREAA